MTEIHELTEAGRDVVKNHDQFPNEEGSTPPEAELRSHLRTHEVDDQGVELDLDRLRNAIDAAKSLFDHGRASERTRMDSNLAPIVRESIRVPLRVAALPGFWQYLSLLEYPDLVTTRWSRDNDIQEKFLGTQKDLYSNYLARLWWGAELTRNEETGDYFATHRLFTKQRLVNYLMDSSFRRSRPAARAFATVLSGESQPTIDPVGKRFNASRSVIELDSRSEEEIVEQLKKIKSKVA
jgi:hypothetical protein